ncbi:PadR family transcriptional regulator [Streptomyces populi]
MTPQTLWVLRALLDHPGRELYGRELSKLTGLMPGTIHPIMVRLEDEGWIASRKEDIDPSQEKRPARRYFRLTATGALRASSAVTEARRRREAIQHGSPATGNGEVGWCPPSPA